MGKKLEQAIAILNGAVGDHLARTGNGLATSMILVHRGRELEMRREALAAVHPNATSRIVVLVHGLMCTEDIWTHEDGGDYGSLLARDGGYTPYYVRYNTGLPIADNGVFFAELLERLVMEHPVPVTEILPLGYSMGGLVVRAACHAATTEKHTWPTLVERAVYVGTPHLGAPMERVGRVVTKLLSSIPDPYTKLAGELADLRSDGVKDLGDADLRHEDRERRVARIGLRDPRHPVPLLPSIQHYLVAGSVWADPRLARLFGDAIVPVPSSTDGTCIDAATLAIPPSHVRIVEKTNHVMLAHDREVYAQIRALLALDDLTPPEAHGEAAGATIEASGEESTADRVRGLRALAFEVVDHGTKAVEEVHKATAARTFTVLEAIPPIATPSKVVHVAHDAYLSAVYGSIRAVGKVVGKTVEVALDLAEARREASGAREEHDVPEGEGREGLAGVEHRDETDVGE